MNCLCFLWVAGRVDELVLHPPQPKCLTQLLGALRAGAVPRGNEATASLCYSAARSYAQKCQLLCESRVLIGASKLDLGRATQHAARLPQPQCHQSHATPHAHHLQSHHAHRRSGCCPHMLSAHHKFGVPQFRKACPGSRPFSGQLTKPAATRVLHGRSCTIRSLPCIQTL